MLLKIGAYFASIDNQNHDNIYYIRFMYLRMDFYHACWLLTDIDTHKDIME